MSQNAPLQRSLSQNDAIHLYLEQVASELQNGGYTMQDVCKAIIKVEIRPTKENVKEIIWREIQKAMFNKVSTKELTTNEVDKVYQVMAQFLAREFEISLPFPSQENSPNYLETLWNKLK